MTFPWVILTLSFLTSAKKYACFKINKIMEGLLTSWRLWLLVDPWSLLNRSSPLPISSAMARPPNSSAARTWPEVRTDLREPFRVLPGNLDFNMMNASANCSSHCWYWCVCDRFSSRQRSQGRIKGSQRKHQPFSFSECNWFFSRTNKLRFSKCCRTRTKIIVFEMRKMMWFSQKSTLKKVQKNYKYILFGRFAIPRPLFFIRYGKDSFGLNKTPWSRHLSWQRFCQWTIKRERRERTRTFGCFHTFHVCIWSIWPYPILSKFWEIMCKAQGHILTATKITTKLRTKSLILNRRATIKSQRHDIPLKTHSRSLFLPFAD